MYKSWNISYSASTEQFNKMPKKVPEKSVERLLASLNFHKTERFETDDKTEQKPTWKVLEYMCFQWVEGTSVAELLFILLLLNAGRLFQVKCTLW
jgi:hypothetical protein